MNTDELAKYIEAQITNLEKYTDNNEFIKGYIRALEDTLARIKG